MNTSNKQQPTLIIACAVFEKFLSRTQALSAMRVHILDYGLHLTPRKMKSAIQSRLDRLAVPHRVLLGYGLCGNGLAGLKARCHTLIIPVVDDCISIFWGSRASFLKAFRAEPATYYLTPGWLECAGEPRSEYIQCCKRYGPDKAGWIADAQYRNYRKLCFIAFTQDELEAYRPRALQVAEFCRNRWEWQYAERVGSDALIRQLLEFGRVDDCSRAAELHGGFLVIHPGEEVRQEQFMLR